MPRPAARSHGPLERQPALPWADPLPAPAERPGRPKTANGEPVPPSGWAWTSWRPADRGWSVAVLAAGTGGAEITIDAEPDAGRDGPVRVARYVVRRWTPTRGGTLRCAEPARTAPTFEAATALAVETIR